MKTFFALLSIVALVSQLSLAIEKDFEKNKKIFHPCSLAGHPILLRYSAETFQEVEKRGFAALLFSSKHDGFVIIKIPT